MKKIKNWIDKELPGVVNEIETHLNDTYAVNTVEGINIAGRDAVYSVLDNLHAVLFPGCFTRNAIQKKDLNDYLSTLLKQSMLDLFGQVKNAYKYFCRIKSCEGCDCDTMTEDALVSLFSALPTVRKTLLTDIEAAYEGDPAAQSFDEIVLSYPFIDAIATHRIAHELYKKDVPLIPRIMSERSHSRTGIDIHPGATIGDKFFIDHGTGVVIGETTTIGKNVKIYQGVTLGALSFPLDENGNPVKGIKRHPNIEDDVVIYAGATILGGKTTIGAGSVVGGSVWLTHSVPPGSKIYYKQPRASFENGAGI